MSVSPLTSSARTSPAARGDASSRPSDEVERSKVATGLTAAGLYGKWVKGLAIDRPRILAAYPIAADKGGGALRRWWVELAGGYATNAVVPITGDIHPQLRIGSFVKDLPTIPKGWDRSYRASVIAGAGVIAASAAYGAVNLGEALHDGGPEALVDSRTGRTGVLGSVVGVLNLGVIGVGVAASKGHGNTAIGRAATRFGASFLAPIHSSTAVTAARAASVLPVLLNEWGFLDFLDEGSASDPITNARETAIHLLHFVPGLDDHLPDDTKAAGE